MDIKKINEEKDRCCGCSACAAACPKQCISMKADDEGFLYPKINYDLCIQCGRCRRACPVINQTRTDTAPDCYVAYSKDDSIRKSSSSGGIFTELAYLTLEDNGIVFGVALDESMKVHHQSAASPEEIAPLRGSKYVQSDMEDTYLRAKEAIDTGKNVYFSGTPCQVAGLYTYLGYRPSNLITQDIICHGVPSPLVWEKYVNTYSQVEAAEFRNKKYGWHYFSMHIQTPKKNYYKRLDEDFYLKLFLDNTILRPICYNCPLKKCRSLADFTLGDCWTLGRVTEKVKDTDEGLSLVIVNTESARQVMDSLSLNNRIESVKVDTQKALASQSALKQSVKPNSNRDAFFKRIHSDDFDFLRNTWYQTTISDKLHTKYIFLKAKIRFALKNRKK